MLISGVLYQHFGDYFYSPEKNPENHAEKKKKIKKSKKLRLLKNINDRALNWKSMVLKNVSVGAKNEKYLYL